MTRNDPGVSGDKSKTPEMVAKFYNLVTDFYECVVLGAACCLCRVVRVCWLCGVLIVLCSAVA